MLGEFCDSDTNPSAEELFAIIKPKEIARPGIAGPFWVGRQYEQSGTPDIVEWMMDILEKRQGNEPAQMPFNGIDFHLHELCDGSVDVIERILNGGHKWLALQKRLRNRHIHGTRKEGGSVFPAPPRSRQ